MNNVEIVSLIYKDNVLRAYCLKNIDSPCVGLSTFKYLKAVDDDISRPDSVFSKFYKILGYSLLVNTHEKIHVFKFCRRDDNIDNIDKLHEEERDMVRESLIDTLPEINMEDIEVRYNFITMCYDHYLTIVVQQ